MEHRPSEDELIAKYFRPMAGEGGMALLDDAARLAGEAGRDLVLKVDAIVGGVHFFPSDPPQDVAWKALAVNLSDLAAKGAEPRGFLLALALPPDWTEEWLAAFSEGLQAGAEATGCPLLGGDTVKTPGPLTVSVTVIGSVPAGRMPVRMAAQPGDVILASGTIGDAALGLALRLDPDARWAKALTPAQREHLLSRYLRPQPRLALGPALLAYAKASMDVSDGLVGDLRKMLAASGVGGALDLDAAPLSEAAKTAIAHEPSLLERAVTGGDDYEVLCTIEPGQVEAFRSQAAALGVPATPIGTVGSAGDPFVVLRHGAPVSLAHGSFSHF
ncbi:thiamine-phosphate kinase [Alsobacter soli]|uniref:Thiamine-monophosphate kinase n=1 Tax=Alsobacter soli TaxID=2109933 RepID=A0A2T1HY56_9HYPH|nr:thiamine-phosphate kinase [Alsobacter soli]PSC06429.1 thiamine-phosphate kinase [Alsobacter soli]